jgi:hypothetical protein
MKLALAEIPEYVREVVAFKIMEMAPLSGNVKRYSSTRWSPNTLVHSAIDARYAYDIPEFVVSASIQCRMCKTLSEKTNE